jgi:ABC-type transporter Mla subunit MlaD
VTAPAQTADELRIAERYLWVLDYVSRCADAVRHGDWSELDDAAQDLARRAAQLAEAARELHDPATAPRAHVLLTIAAEHNRDSQVARLLHPNPPGTTGKATAAFPDPFSHPGR